MSSVHCLLLESIHSTAHEVFVREGIAVTAKRQALEPREVVAALNETGADLQALGIRSKTHVGNDVFSQVPNLAVIGAFCIGTDQVDLAAARRQGIAVFNAPFSSTRSVAELVMGELIILARQIFPRSMAAHQGRWAKSAEGAHEIRGKTLGIVGYGHIGSQLSILAEAMGMRVLFHDIVSKLPLGNAKAASSLNELLGASDFTSLHVPDTDLTRGLIGAAELRAMKRGSYLVNASRGQVVDLEALREVLAEGHLAGAAVDVFPAEPAGKDDPFVSPLQGLEQVILTPHIGGSTQEAQANIGHEVATAVTAFLKTGRTLGCVNLPALDAPLEAGVSRIVNVHANMPGVLSAINRVIAESSVNIVGQHLGTVEDVGLLFIDMVLGSEPRLALQLCQGIAGLPASVKTRLVSAGRE